ncbi:MAG TPA: NUDIX domain-containing protein [Ktedonobacterales bacterium]|jgi:ADP-ribose pyrophosphatase YjhB (NUDIX family)
MTFDASRYRQGYSVGAGAVVLFGDKILLVQMGYGQHENHWAIPGGYVEPGETADLTAQREVFEETGVNAEVRGLIAVRSRIHPDENSTYLIFLLQATSEDAHADGIEVRDARFFGLDEAFSLPNITPLSRIFVAKAREGHLRIFEQTAVPAYPTSEFVLFI